MPTGDPMCPTCGRWNCVGLFGSQYPYLGVGWTSWSWPPRAIIGSLYDGTPAPVSKTPCAWIAKVTHNFDAWIVGSAADPDNADPRDYDVLVPFYMWHSATCMVPPDAKPNSFGGWKFTDVQTRKEIDVWPGDLSRLAQRPAFKFAYHPKTGTRIKVIE